MSVSGSRKKVIGAVILTAMLGACGGGGGLFGNTFRNEETSLDAYTPEQIFERGEYELNQNKGEDAAFYFSEIERL
ncbi:MAG: outer membrane protein assembly factor BamD, partial [Paracoccaceae bacterium]